MSLPKTCPWLGLNPSTYETTPDHLPSHPSMITTPTTAEELLDYWPGNIPFKGRLVSDDGSCMCAQGQALHFLGNLTVNELRNISQCAADKRVAELFGISVTHSVLLRIINDRQKGAPSNVIRNPEQVLGDQAQILLAFWRHLDCMTPAAWAAAWKAAWAAAWAAAGKAAWAAAGASNEIQGAAVMRAKGLPFFFLPLFGFSDPEAVIAASI
jgi:hypothetical protein